MMNRMNGRGRIGAMAIVVALAAAFSASGAKAQYFRLRQEAQKIDIIKDSKKDSVILTRMSPFAVPPINDTLPLVYHEPMPDSIMPRGAVVIGKIYLRNNDDMDLVDELEEIARANGANYIVSFTEPKGYRNREGDHYYRASALLLRVLDESFIKEKDLTMSYYETNGLTSFADVGKWYDAYGRQLGMSTEQSQSNQAEIQETLNFDR